MSDVSDVLHFYSLHLKAPKDAKDILQARIWEQKNGL